MDFEGRKRRWAWSSRVVALTAVLLAVTSPVPSATVPEAARLLHGDVCRALVAGDSARAADLLPRVRSISPALAASLQYGYLEGVLFEEGGDRQAAAGAYRAYLERRGDTALLAPYARLALAGLLEQAGDHAAAAESYRLAVRAGGRRWPRHGEALSGAVRAVAASGDCLTAAELLRQFQGRRQRLLEREAGVRLARCRLAAGEVEAARWRLQLLLSEDQGDDPALEAYRLLLEMKPGEAGPASRSMFSSPREEAWYMGNAAYRNRLFPEAVAWFEKLLDMPGDDSYGDKATFLLGRCRLWQGDFASARQWFLLAGERFPRSLSGQDGKYFAAVCHLRTGDHEAAFTELEALYTARTRQTVALKALTSAAWPLKRMGDARGLDRLAVRAAELGADRTTRAELLMHEADVRRRSGDVDGALLTLKQVTNLADRDETVYAEAVLWIARLLADQGRRPETLQQCLSLSQLDVPLLFRHEAREIASSLAGEMGEGQDRIILRGARNLLDAEDHVAAREELEKFLLTCGWSDQRRVALNLLQELYRREVPYNIPYWVRPVLPADLEGASGPGVDGDGLRRAAALLRIGQFDDAADELEAAGNRSDLDRYDRDYAVALWSLLGGNNALSVRAAERLTRAIPPSVVREALPLNIRLMQYPGHFWPIVERQAERYGLDPLLVLALLREESRFGSGVRSTAAARGLMQILPETARAVADRQGIDGYAGAADLYRPEVSIAIGAAYLAELLQRFEGNVPAALSAYNGGEANAERWIAGCSDPDDPFDFIREVTFRESRHYVIKVLSGYRAYKDLSRKLAGHTAEIVGSFVDWDLLAADLPNRPREEQPDGQ